jgi:hypothetical protein
VGTPEPAKAAFVGDPIEGAGFTRWPIQLNNVLSEFRLAELSGRHPTMDAYFLRCLWSDDESSAIVVTSDQHIVEVDVASRTIKSIIRTEGLSDIARFPGGWVVYQNSFRQAKRIVGAGFYSVDQLFNLIQLDGSLTVQNCLRGKFSHEVCSGRQSMWVYTDRLAFNFERGTVEEIIFEPGPEGPSDVGTLRERVLSADGASMYCRNDLHLERYRMTGAKMSWAERLDGFSGVSPDGLLLFGRQPGQEQTITVFLANMPEAPVLRFAEPDTFKFKVAAHGRHVCYYHFQRDEKEARVNLVVIGPDRTLAVPVARSEPSEPLPLGNYFISPSGRTALVAGNSSQPESIFWLEISD